MIRSDRWRSFASGSGALLAIMIAGIAIQHFRHGWPFSLHHREGGVGAALGIEDRKGAEAGRTHPRVPVEVGPSKRSSIALRVDPVRRMTISKLLRAVATVIPDESRISHVHTRVSGWVERFYVNTTGQAVRAGQSLAGIFSQELLASQNEYLAARRSAKQAPVSVVLQGARQRLGVLGMTEREIRSIEETGEVRRVVAVTAPRSGVVIHRGISVGTAVDPSTELLTIADLSRVWIVAEVPETEIHGLQKGTLARIEVPASGRPPFQASVDFLHPTLSERTRTLRVRFAVANGDGTLRPGLYGTVEFQMRPRDVLTVPRDAVVDTGETQHVFVVEHEGRFVPRTVRLGARLEDRIEVTEGLTEKDSVVASGVFLIDSESRLRASGGASQHAHGAPKDPPASVPTGANHKGH